MGMGDELMALGHVQRSLRKASLSWNQYHEKISRATIIGLTGTARWSSVWEGVLTEHAHGHAPTEKGLRFVNGPGCRPYIERTTGQYFVWKDYEPAPAQLSISNEKSLTWNLDRFNGKVLFGLHTKREVISKNKSWPSWSHLLDAAALAGVDFAIVADRKVDVDGRFLNDLFIAEDFQHLSAVMRRANGYIGLEGGLHHLAAAWGKPAVVLMGGFIGTNSIAYDVPNHRYIQKTDLFCGMLDECQHCRKAWAKIGVDEVIETAKGLGLWNAA